jgi:hypothetical protein
MEILVEIGYQNAVLVGFGGWKTRFWWVFGSQGSVLGSGIKKTGP